MGNNLLYGLAAGLGFATGSKLFDLTLSVIIWQLFLPYSGG